MKKILIIICFAISGCYYDKEEELYGSIPCDVTNTAYTTTVAGIMNAYGCVGCHSGTTPSANINLQNYTGVKTVALNGKLLGAINHSPGFSPMPQGNGKMSACDISKIKAWIDAGSINN